MDDNTRKELIKHLSNEIGKLSDYLLTLRSRMAYTVMIGPFIIVGSVLVAMKDSSFRADRPHVCLTALAALAATISYMGLAYYGARLDTHATEQSNRWRDAIALLSAGEDVSSHQLRFTDYRPYAAYFSAFTLVVAGFASIIVVVSQLLSTSK